MYFHIVYGGGIRRYGGAGRNSQRRKAKIRFGQKPISPRSYLQYDFFLKFYPMFLLCTIFIFQKYLNISLSLRYKLILSIIFKLK